MRMTRAQTDRSGNGRALFTLASFSIVTGCSATAQVAPLAYGQSAQSSLVAQNAVPPIRVDSRTADQVIVSDTFSNVVKVFDSAGRLQTRLEKGINEPFGLATDSARNLYVANAGDSNVLVYAEPYTSVSLTISVPGQYPSDVAIGPAGLVAVMDTALPSGGASVSFYEKGSATACATVDEPTWNDTYFGAFDGSGNLFVDGYDQVGNSMVGEISGGCSATSFQPLTYDNTISGIAGLQVVNGNVLILSQNYSTFTPEIFTYAPPVKGSLGSPIATTNLSAGLEMVSFAMARGDRDLWTVHSDVAYGRLKYTYPGGRLVRSYNEPTLVTAFGIAVNPAASP